MIVSLLALVLACAFRSSLSTDLCSMQDGGVRSDRVHPADNSSPRNLIEILPLGKLVVLVEVTLRQLLNALANGVS